ncbi:MAG: acyl transferase [Bacteroidota bacterium]|nr:acyl transferase [Bacteroidota bacterium]MDP4213615.1 acyl transferase [Bacteroidota bacterium]MDP4248481.1 acyl transferase [Bacteroidota bacterium]
MTPGASLHQYGGIPDRLPENFTPEAIRIFNIQYVKNGLYRQFADSFRVHPASVSTPEQIPFLPISFFKTHPVKTGTFAPEITFESSGTTGQRVSRHEVKSVALYRDSFTRGFELFYGPVTDYCIIGLLPAYLERSGSSLVFMVDELIRESRHPESGFYLYAFEALHALLSDLEKRKQKSLLIGVSFALLDFVERFPIPLKYTLVMETGGMKGRREEITRAQLHDTLIEGFGLQTIHSEYGMTELLSQAYSDGNGIYRPVPWMKAMIRKEDDPLDVQQTGEGLLNIIDLANRDSCAFVATDDLARVYPDGSFEVLGRMDNSDLRGCSLLAV